MFEIPKKINIAGVDVKVNIKDSMLTDESNFGHYNGRTFDINIEKDMDIQQQRLTFIHEVIEGFNHIYSLELEHDTICKLEVAVNQFISTNNIKGAK